MIILTIRTDKPEAEIGLFNGDQKLIYKVWQAHRQLAETLHQEIVNNLQKIDKNWEDLRAIVVFKGPGSFTGLRIGLAVGNSLASGLGIPIVGAQKKDWIESGIKKLLQNQDDKVAAADYGSPAKTTLPK